MKPLRPTAPNPIQLLQARCVQAFRNKAYPECIAAAQQLLAHSRNDGKAWAMLGQAQIQVGQLVQGIDSLRAACRLQRNEPALWDMLGQALRMNGQFEDADDAHRKALKLQPGNLLLWLNAAHSARDGKAFDKTLRYARQAVALEPRSPQAQHALGMALAYNSLLDEAIPVLHEALRLQPDYPAALTSLRMALYKLIRAGRFQDAKPHYEAILARDDASSPFWLPYLYGAAHDSHTPPEASAQAHFRYGEQLEAPWRPQWGGWSNSREAERPLRIGFVSGDLREHAVSFFIEPIWKVLKREGYRLHVYHTAKDEDQVSARMQALVDDWNHVHGLDDGALAARIRNDAIDILMDLSGHTADHRLAVFARKPAPLQVSWIGYPHTTGLSSIDYQFISAHAAPSTTLAPQFSEQLVRLAYSSVFAGAADRPPIAPPPRLRNPFFTFGSFHRAAKITEATLDLWSQVLQQAPDARMLLGAVLSDEAEQTLVQQFAARGIGAERLIIRRNTSLLDYLALHAEVDLLLDAIPFAGATTTYHGLSMGVPTLTLTGPSLQRSHGAGLLAQNGFHEWIADSEARFVELAVAAASMAPEALAQYRAEVGERFATAQAEAAERCDMGRALRLIWQRWCAGLPATALDLSAPAGSERQGDGGSPT